MPYATYTPPRRLSGVFNNWHPEVPHSSLPKSGQKFVAQSTAVSSQTGVAGMAVRQRFFVPPYFSGLGETSSSSFSTQIDNAVQWVKDNPVLAGAGALGLFLLLGRRR